MVKSIMDAVTIPVMAKIRIGHFVEAQVSSLVPNPHDLLPDLSITDPPTNRYRLYRRV